MNGGTFDNNGSSSMDAFGTVTIDANVIGNGSFAVAFEYTINPAGTLEFVKSVGAGESITLDSGIVQVDQPKTFDAAVTLAGSSIAGTAIDLIGLATADSYSYANDLLKIWAGNKVIDTLHLTDQTQYGFDVVKTSGSVNVAPLTSSGETMPGALPIHVGT